MVKIMRWNFELWGFPVGKIGLGKPISLPGYRRIRGKKKLSAEAKTNDADIQIHELPQRQQRARIWRVWYGRRWRRGWDDTRTAAADDREECTLCYWTRYERGF
jgi:hypothetical protein